MGFEHTPIEYRKSYATLCVIMLTPSTPSIDVATAEHRVTDTGKVLKYTLTNTETG